MGHSSECASRAKGALGRDCATIAKITLTAEEKKLAQGPSLTDVGQYDVRQLAADAPHHLFYQVASL